MKDKRKKLSKAAALFVVLVVALTAGACDFVSPTEPELPYCSELGLKQRDHECKVDPSPLHEPA